ERERRGDHLVTRADSRVSHAEVQSGGAARDRGRVKRADPLREEALELLRHWPEREASRPEHLRDELDLALADHGLRERDLASVGGSHASARAPATKSSQWAHRSLRPLTVSRYAF